MRKAMIKKTTAALLTAAMAVSLAGCGKGENNADSGKSDDVSKEVQYSQIKLGEDYTDIKAAIQMILGIWHSQLQ